MTGGFFLFYIATQAYIGPISQPACQMAAATLRNEGVICRQAISLYSCEVGGRPGTTTICPIFSPLPEVTKKGDRLP